MALGQLCNTVSRKEMALGGRAGFIFEGFGVDVDVDVDGCELGFFEELMAPVGLIRRAFFCGAELLSSLSDEMVTTFEEEVPPAGFLFARLGSGSLVGSWSESKNAPLSKNSKKANQTLTIDVNLLRK